MPVTLCNRSSFSRHRGLARSVVSSSSSSVAIPAFSHVIWAAMSFLRRALVPARRFCSAVRMPISGWRRPRRARSSGVWASGTARGGGRLTAAPCATARAANASVLAHWPGARAKSRTWRGCTTTTGRPAVAKALVPMRSRPPVAANTRRAGRRVCLRSTSIVTPLGSFGTAHRSPEGRRALSNWALATSMPTKQGLSLLRTPVHPPWHIRAQWHHTTVRALGGQDVTPHAPLRSRRPKAKTVYHVLEPSAGASPRHL